jgi:hypothetical protein
MGDVRQTIRLGFLAARQVRRDIPITAVTQYHCNCSKLCYAQSVSRCLNMRLADDKMFTLSMMLVIPQYAEMGIDEGPEW